MSRTYLINLFGKDYSTDPATDVTLRLSNMEYHKADHPYLSRVVSLTLSYDMESSYGQTQESQASIKIVNQNGVLDDYLYKTMLSGEIRRGDNTKDYNDTNFPVIWKGPIRSYRSGVNSVDIVLADIIGFANLTVDDNTLELPAFLASNAVDVFDGEGFAGTLSKGYLTVNENDFSTGIEASDIDTDQFDALDTEYNYLLFVRPSEIKQTILKLIDEVLVGIPWVIASKRNGKATCVRFLTSITDSDHDFVDVDNLTIDAIYPLAEAQFSYPGVTDESVQGATGGTFLAANYNAQNIKNRYPNQWRTESGREIKSFRAQNADRRRDVDAITSKLLQTFALLFNRVKFVTHKNIDDVELGDKIKIVSERYNFKTGKYGFVTRIQERMSGEHSVEAWVINDDTAPIAVLQDSQMWTLPAMSTVVRTTSEYNGTYSGLTLAVPAYLTDSGAEVIASIEFGCKNSNTNKNMRFRITFQDTSGELNEDIFSSGYIEFDFISVVNRLETNHDYLPQRKKVVITKDRNDVQTGNYHSVQWEENSSGYLLLQCDDVNASISGLSVFYRLLLLADYSSLDTTGIVLKISKSPYPPFPVPSQTVIDVTRHYSWNGYENFSIAFTTLDIENVSHVIVETRVESTGGVSSGWIESSETTSLNTRGSIDYTKDTPIIRVTNERFGDSNENRDLFGIRKVIDWTLGNVIRIRIRVIPVNPDGLRGSQSNTVVMDI